MSEWMYDNKEVTEVPEGYVAFVYMIHVGSNFYIGKKTFYNSIKRPPLAGKKRHRRDTRESNWKKYCSSSDIVKSLVEEGFEPKRRILYLCKTQKEATYWETKLLFDMITQDGCINGNIQGKFFKEEIMKWNQ